MIRNIIISSILALFSGLVSPRAQAFIDSEDSLRANIVELIENGQDLEEDFTKTNMDSAFLLFDSAATLAVRKLGESDTLHVISLLHQTNNRLRIGDCDLALKIAQRALNIVENSYARDSDLRLEALSRLSDAYGQTTDFVNSAIIEEEIINIIDQIEIRTKSHTRLLIQSMGGLATSRLQQGDLSYGNFEYLKSKLKLIEDNFGKENQWYAASYLGLGYHLLYMRKFDEAEEYIYKGDSLVKEQFPPEDHTSTYSSVMVMLFDIVRGRLDAADSLLQREYEIVNRTFGEEHVHYPLLVRRKAQLLLARDSLDRAVETAQELVEIYRERSSHPTMMLMQALRLLGKIAFVAGNHEIYNQATNELIDIKHTYLFNAFRYASESLKLSYVRRYPVLESILFSGLVESANPDIINSAVEMALNGKGLAFDAMAAQQSAAMCSDEPYLDSLLDEHSRISDRIAGMALSSREIPSVSIDSLFSQKEQIESVISGFCSNIDYAEERKRIEVCDIEAELPPNSVFLDYVKYEHYDYEKHYPYGQDSMYAVIIYEADKQVEIIGLGDSDEIDRSIMKYRSEMAGALASQLNGSSTQSLNDYTDAANDLYDRLIVPLSSALKTSKQVFVATDGMLNLLPFETLTKDGDNFLIEDHQFIYLTSGRDLLKEETDKSSGDAMVLADPDFMIDPIALPALDTSESASMFAYRGNTDKAECLGSMFSPLPMTRQEGLSVADLLGKTGQYDISYLESDQAREGVLKNLDQAPDILHIATHGYFCEHAENAYMSNPLLRSGIILAGANRTIGETNKGGSGGEDGILTAMEVSGLNLIGTDLVVLSACQTGIGDVQSGEGVFGLRRAFQHAGVKSVVMSMFAVPDESTSDLMERFYENWLSGQSKSLALRSASLNILNERRAKGQSTHPLFWGGFILVGDPD